MERLKSSLSGILLVSALFFLFSIMISSPAFATIYACNSTGHLTNTFYTNESVYVSGNVSAISQDVDVYVVSHRTTWPNGTSITDISLKYEIITTNSSGGIPTTEIMELPNAGNYDVVADINRDGVFNTTIDYVDNTSVAGFSVIETPKPTLTVDLGPYHPSSHNWNLEADSGHNVMMQIEVEASTLEDVKMKSASIAGLGTGDDGQDISVVYFIYDLNGDGNYTSGDVIVSYGKYNRDDGAIFFDMGVGFVIFANRSSRFMITYAMDTAGSVDDTYRFDLINMVAIGDSSGDTAIVNGLPLSSAVKTISQASSDTTTTTTEPGETTTTTTTTTIPTDQCQEDSDCPGLSCSDKKKTTYKCTYDTQTEVNVCAATIVSVECCGDGDCTKKYYCKDYECVKGGRGGFSEWLRSLTGKGGEGEKVDYKWTIISIVIVVAAVLIIFFIIKNRKKKGPWKTEKEYERDWDSLHKKWK